MRIHKTVLAVAVFVLANAMPSPAQDNMTILPVKNGTICYEKVIKVDEKMTKSDLFQKTKQWVAEYFPATSIHRPLQLEDPENGIIIVLLGLGSISPNKVNFSYNDITCSGKIQVKNGKYKYTFTNFKATFISRDGGELTKINTDFDHYLEQGKRLDKIDMGVLESIDYMMKNIIGHLNDTLKEAVVDNF